MDASTAKTDWDALADACPPAVPTEAVLGYLNFSEGKADPRFARQFDDICVWLGQQLSDADWRAPFHLLLACLPKLQSRGAAAFRDTTQAEQVLRVVRDHVVPGYLDWHRDLLFHQGEATICGAFFLVRVLEAVLEQGGPWDRPERVVPAALRHVNDFVGYRPIPVLESRPRGEPYDHERVRPVPLYIRGAGVARGPYHDLIAQAIELLQQANPDLLHDSHLHLELLDELAFDPRAYDHLHPANRRPNHVFGEWDPHHLDSHGRHRRYVVRQLVLDALMIRLGRFQLEVSAARPEPQKPNSEALFESGAVLAATILMGAGVCGSSPTTHDSTVSLGKLMPIVARCRDQFYAELLTRMTGVHAERLREEAKRSRQPFGSVRQELNQFMAGHRAEQMQQRQLSLMFAVMGYPETSRAQANRIPVTSIRILSEVLSRLTTGQLLVDQCRPDQLAAAAKLLPEIEDLLERGMQCGALVDPWNILGFQGQFPLFAAVEDTVQDPRVLELLHVVEQLLALYARLLSEAAAAGEERLVAKLRPELTAFAESWDQYATHEVGDLPRVHGGEAAESADHVAKALAHWRKRGEQAADLGFWRDHLKDFASPKAFALVVDALIRKRDYRAAHGLLMNWLSQADTIPPEDGPYSFNVLALRWMLEVTGGGENGLTEAPWPLVQRFFSHLEANADTWWQVPELQVVRQRRPGRAKDDEDNVYGAAYEDVTYRDSTDDGVEGSLQEGGPSNEPFDLEIEGESLNKRVTFLATACRLWQIAARQARRGRAARDESARDALAPWKVAAFHFQERLLTLLDDLHAFELPKPVGTHESLVEYDHHRAVKEQLLDTVIATCLEATLAVRALRGATEDPPPLPGRRGGHRNDWETFARHLGAAILQGDHARARQVLPGFLRSFQQEPLLYVPLEAGGHPRQILRTRLAQMTLRTLLETLPRLGLLKECYQLLKLARSLEMKNAPPGRKVTEFDRLFQSGIQAVTEAVIESARGWNQQQAQPHVVVQLLESVCQPFLLLWLEHSQSLRLSVFEAIEGDRDWEQFQKFLRKYGKDIFNARFMTLGNLRGILSHGVEQYLESLAEEPDPLNPIQLLDDLGKRVKRQDAVRWLDLAIQAIVENYEEYKDYNATTSQSDYGENLPILLEFLRLKAHYEREAWHVKPLVWVHETLAKHPPRRTESSQLWQGAFTHFTRDAAAGHVQQCRKLEATHGIVLRTVADRVEEQFVKPLAVDRLVALIEPAMEEARAAIGYQPSAVGQNQAGGSLPEADGRKPMAEQSPAFMRLLHDLELFTRNPSGVGLDLPVWLRRLEAEVNRVRLARTPVATLTHELFDLPRRRLSKAEIERQLEEWEK
jgi:hypothetical protein